MNNMIGYPNPNAIRPQYPSPADIVPLPYFPDDKGWKPDFPMPGGEQPLPLPYFPNDRFEPSGPNLGDILEGPKQLDGAKKPGKLRRGKKAAKAKAEQEKQARIASLKSEIETLKRDLERRRMNMDNQTNDYARLRQLEQELAQLEGRPGAYELKDKDLLFTGGVKQLGWINQGPSSTMEMRM
jgi:hypothetical protein